MVLSEDKTGRIVKPERRARPELLVFAGHLLHSAVLGGSPATNKLRVNSLHSLCKTVVTAFVLRGRPTNSGPTHSTPRSPDDPVVCRTSSTFWARLLSPVGLLSAVVDSHPPLDFIGDTHIWRSGADYFFSMTRQKAKKIAGQSRLLQDL